MIGKRADASVGAKELILWIVAFVVLVIVIMSIFVWNVPQKINDLFPDFGEDEAEKKLEVSILEQEEIPEKYTNPECPVQYKEILLINTNWIDDRFWIRFNEDEIVNQPEIYIEINKKAKYSSKQWLINPNIFPMFKERDGISKQEAEQIEYIMDSSTKDDFSFRLAEISKEKYWKIGFNTGDLENDMNNLKEQMTEKELLDELNNPQNLVDYEDNIKYRDECK